MFLCILFFLGVLVMLNMVAHNDMFLLCAILLFELLFVAFLHAFLVSFVVVEHGCLYACMLTLFELSFLYLFMLSFLVFLCC